MITVVTGPMGSGKSLELIRLAKTAELANKIVKVFKPALDSRSNAVIKTRFGNIQIPALSFDVSKEIYHHINFESGVIIIDEFQFINDESIINCVLSLSKNHHLIVGGLNKDFLGQPFGYMPQIMALADEIILLKGVCSMCGQPGTETQRLRNGIPDIHGPLIICGDENVKDSIQYECRCKNCAERSEVKVS